MKTFEAKVGIFMILVLVIGFYALPKGKAQNGSLPRPRFEHIWIQNNVGDYESVMSKIEVWHDKETGQETICYTAYDSPYSTSCLLTGRSWK